MSVRVCTIWYRQRNRCLIKHGFVWARIRGEPICVCVCLCVGWWCPFMIDLKFVRLSCRVLVGPRRRWVGPVVYDLRWNYRIWLREVATDDGWQVQGGRGGSFDGFVITRAKLYVWWVSSTPPRLSICVCCCVYWIGWKVVFEIDLGDSTNINVDNRPLIWKGTAVGGRELKGFTYNLGGIQLEFNLVD